MFRIGMVFIVIGFFSGEVFAQTAADQYWWHDRLTQKQRDAEILRVAQTFPNETYVGVSCKVWAQQVVNRASHNVVWLPLNSRYEWLWQWSFDVEVLGTDSWNGTIPWQPGYIIQAQVRAQTGVLPHTMIIVSAGTTGATVIESNWRGDLRVRRRYATWPEFQRQIVHYTLYRVK